jgi:hypothetical protein
MSRPRSGKDVFLRPEQVRAWSDRLAATDKTYRVYPRLITVNDWDKELVLADILAWLPTSISVRRSIFETRARNLRASSVWPLKELMRFGAFLTDPSATNATRSAVPGRNPSHA